MGAAYPCPNGSFASFSLHKGPTRARILFPVFGMGDGDSEANLQLMSPTAGTVKPTHLNPEPEFLTVWSWPPTSELGGQGDQSQCRALGPIRAS